MTRILLAVMIVTMVGCSTTTYKCIYVEPVIEKGCSSEHNICIDFTTGMIMKCEKIKVVK